jgi:glycosyltransferase involved in cell wall biosynthesis
MPSLADVLNPMGIQALGLGLAIVCSNHVGIKDLVADGVNGFACPVTDAEVFARRLRTVLTDPQLLLAMKRASLDLAPRFEVGRVARQIEELLVAAGGEKIWKSV